MRVRVDDREYTLYIDADGIWVMHVWAMTADRGGQWLESIINVSDEDPFKSTVEYDLWR